MRALLDTHALLWWVLDHPSLSRAARRVIARSENIALVSAASAWELSVKVRLGKLSDAEDLLANLASVLERERFETLPISIDHAVRAGQLPGIHHDPFDRMLAAQCQAEGIPIVSGDETFDRYSVRRIW